ncbi:hypothetical protein QR680_010800 [Steinernema hermaphroditum]|uniref:Peptidase A1 domain-containing protein n=1 Tax=Steinernema hermaphroditum TaxID=289476 RepID=A0AA39IRC2_9BILA|nr:hypothetical protein QR680_010800 [Steinernema hermaphroditum]
MLKWFVFLGLVLLCSSLSTKKRSKYPQNVRVNSKYFLPRKTQEKLFHHYPIDASLLATDVYIGRENGADGEFFLDTTSGDLEVHLCPSTNLTDAMKPCYLYQYSPSYINIDNNIAMETFKGQNIDDKWMYNLTFVKSSYKRQNRIGLGWPSLRKYPQDTFYPDVYFHQKPCLRRFRMQVARDGCTGGYTWGAICDEYQEYPTYMVPTTSRSYWQFGFYGLTFGNYTAKFNTNGVVDSTSAYIGMAKKYLKIFMQQINATWDDEYGGYTQWCYGNFPDLELQLYNVVLKIKSEQYLYTWMPLENGKCIVNVEDSGLRGFGPEWYFGLPLFSSYCVSFDYDFGMLSFMYNDMTSDDPNCHT